MKAIAVEQLKGSRVVKLLDLPPPQCESNDVLIEVLAAGVGQWDIMYREGTLDFGVTRVPRVLGWEGAGRVRSVGNKVGRFRAGDRVGFFHYPTEERNNDPFVEGAFEELVCIPESFVGKLPDQLDFVQAAAYPIAALTPYQALQGPIRPNKGDRLLITGGAGGVATCAIQIANQMGAEVLVLASPKHREYLKSLGAKDVFDYHVDFAPELLKKYPGGVNTVYHCTLSNETGSKALKVLKSGGIFCTITDFPPEVSQRKDIRAIRVDVEPSGKPLEEIAAWIVEGKLRLPVEKVFPLEKAQEALDYVASQRVTGKVVLSVAKAA